MSIFQRKPSSL
jgi:peptidoglycan/LPS O-acetylase OafA/YrhL